MLQTKISSKFQLAIPREIRESLHLRRGQRMIFLLKGDVITVAPKRQLAELKGIARGIKPGALREK